MNQMKSSLLKTYFRTHKDVMSVQFEIIPWYNDGRHYYHFPKVPEYVIKSKVNQVCFNYGRTLRYNNTFVLIFLKGFMYMTLETINFRNLKQKVLTSIFILNFNNSINFILSHSFLPTSIQSLQINDFSERQLWIWIS